MFHVKHSLWAVSGGQSSSLNLSFLFFPSALAFRPNGLGSPLRADKASQDSAKEAKMDEDTIIQTPDGPMTWAAWKKKNPVQTPSRRTKGKDLPNKVKKFTDR